MDLDDRFGDFFGDEAGELCPVLNFVVCHDVNCVRGVGLTLQSYMSSRECSRSSQVKRQGQETFEGREDEVMGRDLSVGELSALLAGG